MAFQLEFVGAPLTNTHVYTSHMQVHMQIHVNTSHIDQGDSPIKALGLG